MSEYQNKISSLHLENFTVFEKAGFEFCPGINVLIGANGTGKSHVLKISYALLKAISSGIFSPDFLERIFQQKQTMSFIAVTVEDNFKDVFRLEEADYLMQKKWK
ncbi:MAG: AAA family ATPase [Desulfobacterales bacterium]